MKKKEIVVGVDIGGTNTVYGFVDRDGSELGGGHFPTFSDDPAEILVERLAKAIKSDYMAFDDDDLKLMGMGIGAPNANYRLGTVNHPPNFNWDVVPLVEIVKTHFDMPVAITNDANAAAIGEMTFGSAKGLSDFIVITLGTGLGSGIVVNRNLVFGHDGFAGELGHLNANPHSSRRCGCGKFGCLETYASATGIVTTVRKMLKERGDESELRLIESEHLTSKEIAEAAQKGDVLARDAFEFTGNVLGIRLADMVTALSPHTIFFFGGLANAGPLILEPTKKTMERHLQTVFKDKVQLVLSGLQHRNAAILGAAALILSEIPE